MFWILKVSIAVVCVSGSEIHLWALDDICGVLMYWTAKIRIEAGFWLESYLGAGQFYGTKVIGDTVLNNVLYDYKKKEAKLSGIRETVVRATLKIY